MADAKDPESLARAIKEEPWEPLPGMVKVRCEDCEYWFATPARARIARCPECVLERRKTRCQSSDRRRE
jgi:predicted Zn-ribbon and HTH transcriptional regulator